MYVCGDGGSGEDKERQDQKTIMFIEKENFKTGKAQRKSQLQLSSY